MPMVSKKPSIVTDRRQSILGAERPIKATGVHVDPDVNYADHKLVNIPNPHLPANDGVALTTIEHPRSKRKPGRPHTRLSPKATERIEIELPDRDGDIVVETGVPMPSRRSWGRASFYPIEGLKKRGDFFFIPNGNQVDASCVRSAAKRKGIDVVTRKNFHHKGKIGVGVWRA